MSAPVFLLGPGRSFTTVIAAMLGQHPELYGFPELNLPVANTVGGWLKYTEQPTMRWLRQGLLRALAEVESGSQTDDSVADVEAWLDAHRSMAMTDLVDEIRQAVAPKRVVEKSPHIISNPAHLARLARVAPDALYLHVTRHPFTSCRSMARTDWFSLALRTGSRESYDRSTRPPVFDPQLHWHGSHERIMTFLAGIPPERQRRVRGEDVLAKPEELLIQLCEWIGVSTEPEAIEEMLHPESSPFAMPGPDAAPFGTDPAFLESPALRAFSPPEAPLSGRVPWRGDGRGFMPKVREFAKAFGYEDLSEPERPLPSGFDGKHGALVSIAPDGKGVPMAHANLLDNSYSELPPLKQVSEVDYRTNPAVAWINFGSYSGEDITVSVFDSQNEPAMVAMSNDSHGELWRTSMDVLPSLSADGHLRWVSGVLMARLTFEDGTVTPCIFAGNGAEIVCISQTDGRTIWRNQSGEAGPPRCVRFTADNKLIFATTPGGPGNLGQVVKMDPLTGDIIDIRKLTCSLDIDGRDVAGGFQVFQSIVVEGDYAFVEGMFMPDVQPPTAVDAFMPACLMRFRVSGTEDDRIQPTLGQPIEVIERIGVVGNRRQGGSPSAVRSETGELVIICNGFVSPPNVPNVTPSYQITALRNEPEGLEPLWWLKLEHREDPSIAAAPAVDPVTQTYVAASRFELHLIGQVAEKRGQVVPELSIPAIDLLTEDFRNEVSAAEISSPIILCRDGRKDNFYAYLGLAAWRQGVEDNFALLTALHVDTSTWRVVPVWTASLAADASGQPCPAPRSFAQPALFATNDNATPRVGIAMSTMLSGVAIFT